MSEKNKGNTKALQSQKFIEEALFKLMEKEPYHKITIQEIADMAQLSRRTFYRNYGVKEDVILGYFHRICKEYEANLRIADNLSLSGIATVFFSTMQKHLDFLFLINKNNLVELLIREMDVFLLPLHQELKGKSYDDDLELTRIALTFSIGGFGRILVLWLNEGAKKTPEELAMLLGKALQLIM